MLLSHLAIYFCKCENMKYAEICMQQNRWNWYDWSGKMLKEEMPYECLMDGIGMWKIVVNTWEFITSKKNGLWW